MELASDCQCESAASLTGRRTSGGRVGVSAGDPGQKFVFFIIWISGFLFVRRVIERDRVSACVCVRCCRRLLVVYA